jgi:uncharacterized protein (TIGR04255 family)
VGPGEVPALKPFRLAAEDDSEFITLAIHSFAFISKRYKTFEQFRSRFAEVFGRFKECFQPIHINRTGLRYINWLPREFGSSRQDGQLHPALTLRIDTGSPWRVSAQIIAPQIVFQVAAGERQVLRVALAPDASAQAAPPGLQSLAPVLLDFDCSCTGPVSIDAVEGLLDEAHVEIDNAFFGLGTPEYLKYLKGETS